MRVYELMRTEFLSVGPDTPLTELRDDLAERSERHAAVVTPGNDRHGIVSHEDVYWGLLMGLPREETATGTVPPRVADVMTSPAPSVEDDDDVARACAVLCRLVTDALLVLREGRPVGVLGVHDVIRSVAEGQLLDPLEALWPSIAQRRASPPERAPRSLEPSGRGRYPD